jgi:hypothetical protein
MGLNHRGKPRFKPGRDVAAPAAPAKSFNERRRMFAIVDGAVRVAPEGDARYHRSWFRDEGWITSGDEAREFERIARGFADDRGLFVYKGQDFTPYVWNDLNAAVVAALAEGLGLGGTAKVWFGAVPGGGDSLSGQVYAGTIDDVLEQLAFREAAAGPSVTP